jgi:hypothetical protein
LKQIQKKRTPVSQQPQKDFLGDLVSQGENGKARIRASLGLKNI